MFRLKSVCVLLGVSLAFISSGPAKAQSFGILREVWEGIGGASVADLTDSPDYPDRPTSTHYVTDFFEAPVDILENYGQRMHGYIVPPLTGDYTFWIASDDGGALFLSSDDDPAKATRIARVDGWTSSREWGREANQQSAPIRLVAGRAYYIAALMKEQGGGDNLAVRWRMPNGVDQAPIVATHLLPFGVTFAPPAISRQPANTTVVEGSNARFEVQLSTVGSANFQWHRNAVDLPGANNSVLEYGPIRLSENGSRFSVRVTNLLGSVLSSEAVLTVTPDVTAPAIASVLNIGTTTLRVTFSEPVRAPFATAVANYTISPPRAVTSARFGVASNIVELTLDSLSYGTTYTLTVRNVQDTAQTPNAIATDSRIQFTALEYAPTRVGEPPVAGAVFQGAAFIDITGSGKIGGSRDDFEFAYQVATGDFDRRVRVTAFTPTDPFASAGLVARASLDPTSAFAGLLTTPAQVGSFFMHRPSPGAESVRSGQYPPGYPNTWLRLARSGNSFRGYASWDGITWTELGRATVSMPSAIYLGLAVSSMDEERPATVEFRDPGVGNGGATSTAVPRPLETLGPSSRHTALVISEIMYHPRERADGRNTEFLEIYNADLIDQDLTGHRLSGSVSFAFPDGFRLPAGGFAVIARVPAQFGEVYGLTGMLGPFADGANLPNDSGTIRLRNPQDAILLEVNYGSRDPWPVAADGAGHSLVLSRPSYGEDDFRGWSASHVIGGSPGRTEPQGQQTTDSILINEVLAHTDSPVLDFVELYNHSNEPVDLSGCVLTEDPVVPRFRIPNGTIITPRGFVAFDEQALGFRLDAAGEAIFLISSNLTQVIDAIRFEAQENGVRAGARRTALLNGADLNGADSRRLLRQRRTHRSRSLKS
jgi:hypothetical protein